MLGVVGGATHSVEVVSVYAHRGDLSRPPNSTTGHEHAQHERPATCVWVSVREEGARGGFMDPVKLQGLLGLRARQVCGPSVFGFSTLDSFPGAPRVVLGS